MPRIVTSSELQRNIRDIIDWARTRGDAVIVETYGKPMAVILSFDEYQEYLRYKVRQLDTRHERFERLRQLAEQNAAQSGLDEEEALALADQARQEVYEIRRQRPAKS
ncbi:MAG: type II toxin-antitoxin system Phd/YefM family antitoxin [Chloroflexi bacterium]|nr:type II toxin-antitoxin system Phd/YefM family antitoxin [Chloroflexota bacterium]